MPKTRRHALIGFDICKPNPIKKTNPMTRKLLTTAAILIIAVIAFALSDPGRDGPDQVTTRESPSVFPELN